MTVVHFMQLDHVTVSTLPAHFLIRDVILLKRGLFVVIEAAGGGVFFWIVHRSDQMAGRSVQPLAVLVPESPLHTVKNSEAVSSARSTKQVVDKIIGSRK